MQDRYGTNGNANNSDLPSGNSASKKHPHLFATNSGTTRLRESSYENRALDRPSCLWAPDRIRVINTNFSLPGEIQSILHSSEPPWPLSTERIKCAPDLYQGIRNNSNASLNEHSTEDPLFAVFGPDVTDWLRQGLLKSREE